MYKIIIEAEYKHMWDFLARGELVREIKCDRMNEMAKNLTSCIATYVTNLIHKMTSKMTYINVSICVLIQKTTCALMVFLFCIFVMYSLVICGMWYNLITCTG